MSNFARVFFAVSVIFGSGFYIFEYLLYDLRKALRGSDNSGDQLNRSSKIFEQSYRRDEEVTRNISNILILSSGRSGSSFLGEIFKQNHGRTRYIFEPLRQIIQYPFIPDPLKFKTVHIISKLFMAKSYQCSRHDTDSLPIFGSNSGTCSGGGNVVVKELTSRFPNNGSSILKNLMQFSKSWNMRIVHLVRDPSYVIQSMQRLSWITGNMTSQGELIRLFCKPVWANLRYLRQANNDQISKENYKLVVFRRMMTNPIRTAESLYEFAGMGSLPESVRAWIKSSTHGNEHDSRMPYTTRRNTTEVLHQKIAISNETSYFVQKYCGNITRFIQELRELE